MSGHISAANWANYKAIINDAHDTFNQQSIVWLKSKGGLDRDGEDNLTEQFDSITLKALVQYNHFRTWPTDITTEAGKIDGQTELLIFNVKYLKDLGYINANGNFDYDSAADRFKHNEVIYKSAGESFISQAQDEPLLLQIILQREEIPSGKTQI